MDKSKQQITNFVSHDGEQITTVKEAVLKVVTDEHVRNHQHEEITHALDKEPIEAKGILPEKHTHNMISVKHKTIDHRNKQAIRDQLNAESARFKDSSITHEATHTTYIAPEVASKHVHHHIHEHIQPVIHKETVTHEYIHTTIPIHETHHVDAQHHGTSILPAITMEEFQARKNVWGGNKERRVGELVGCPETYEKKLQSERAKTGENMPLQAV